jgi:predicted nucleic acid-binding protein
MGSVFTQFVQDVLIDGGVVLIGLAPAAMQRLVTVIERYQLDFDDAYQYVVAERENAVIVSFDSDFDRTERGWLTPSQVLATEGLS